MQGRVELTGKIDSAARAIGKFGATAMVAGCIPYRTDAVTVGIYMYMMSGNPIGTEKIENILYYTPAPSVVNLLCHNPCPQEEIENPPRIHPIN